jgi:hypothetical protein
MSYNTELQNSNQELRGILEDINELPDAGESVADAVRYTAQSLTEEQKAQARENIGAVGVTEVRNLVETALEAEKGSIIQSIVAELQTFPVFGYIDENNAITVTSLLLDGTYTLKYENEDGTKTEIGTIIVGTGTGEGSGGDYTPTYVNIISTAKTPTDLTTVFNDGKGYMDGKYASSSSPYYGADSATFVTGLIEATPTSVFYIKGVTIDTSNNHNRLGVFNTSGSPNAVKPFTQMTDYATLETLGTQYYKLTMNTTYISANFTNFKYIMFSAMGSGANCIIATTPIEE